MPRRNHPKRRARPAPVTAPLETPAHHRKPKARTNTPRLPRGPYYAPVLPLVTHADL